VTAELRVVVAQHFVIDDDERRAVGLGEAKKSLLVH
jgi:hypothetical protein